MSEPAEASTCLEITLDPFGFEWNFPDHGVVVWLNKMAKVRMTMQESVLENRRKELRVLLDQMEAHPERDWTEQRKRVDVLRELLTAHIGAGG